MAQLIVEKLFGEAPLTLEVGTATFNIADDMLTIRITFPQQYRDGDIATDEKTGDLINPPRDYWFKAGNATLEVECPVPEGIADNLFSTEIFLDSEDEDNEDLTNFYIANTHYPTFDDRIKITRSGGAYTVSWQGLMPDLKNSRHEVYMKTLFPFSLEAACERLNESGE